jgi:release factor glutamine methyltransferase
VRWPGAAAERGQGRLTPPAPSPLTPTSRGSRLTPHQGTVGAAVEEAHRILDAAGIAEARREAAELYGALVGRAASAAWLERDEPMPEGLAPELAAAARHRAAGWPQAYAAGRANFRGIWLAVDRRVLIPRPETEGLVDVVLSSLAREGGAGGRPRVADVGTGSGAVAIALAIESLATAVALDVSAGALEVARANVETHGVASRVELRRGELLLPLGDAKVDAVVSNPPYLTTAEWDALDPAVRAYEPREALEGGADGLEPTRHLVAQAHLALRPGGLLAVEADAARAAQVAELTAGCGFADCVVLEDLFGRPRYVRARKASDGSL